MTFEASRSQFSQLHFTVVEIDLPGVLNSGYGTSLTEGVSSDTTNTHRFTNIDAPTLPESDIYRMITAINETPAKLQSQAGLSSRGSGSITLVDSKGDPNINLPSVTDEVRAKGTYLAKLDARNIMVNKPLRIMNYRLESDGSIDLANSETRHYLIESFDNSGNGKWQLKFKDELSRVNLDETVFPLTPETSLTSDINASVTTIPVNDGTLFTALQTIRIGDELMKIASISSNNLIVGSRGSDISYTNTLSTTVAEEHSSGDEVFICDICDDESIDVFIKRVLVAIGVDASYIPTADWANEIAEWHPLDLLNTIWIESLDSGEVLKKVLGDYLMDLWFDPIAQEVKLSAVSQWKTSDATLTEGIEIDFESVRRKKEEGLRYTRGLVIYDKRNLVTSDDVENFKKASIYKRTDLETSDNYGEPKTMRLGFSSLLDKDAADLLVNRFVSRNINPYSYSWTTQEKKLTFSTGDVANIVVDANVGFNGSISSGSRAQIMSIKPVYSNMGREYKVTALSYEPVFGDTEIVITGNVFDLNIHNYIGAPSQVVNMVIIFDAATVGSTSAETKGIRAGNFAAGSTLKFILANGSDLQAKGGNGGHGQGIVVKSSGFIVAAGGLTNGLDGAIVYDAEGIDTDIYFSGDSSAISTTYQLADGYIRAPSGGDGGFTAAIGGFGDLEEGAGGDGGNGIEVGEGGLDGTYNGVETTIGGSAGSTAGAWGVSGSNNSAVGGLAGSGVVDSGATVTFYGDTTARYVNGNGDH